MARLIGTQADDVFAVVDDGVGTITLNRPERRNAITTDMLVGLGDILVDLDRSSDVGCIVITGAGGAFCSGGDVRDFSERGGEGFGSAEVDPALVAAQVAHQRRTVGLIHDTDKPVVAALPGAAAGAGLGFALAADMRIGSPRALMVTAFAGVGLAGDYGVTWLLNQLVGPSRTSELLFLSPRLDAQRCLELGLLNAVTGDHDLVDRTSALARTLADGPRTAISFMKQNVRDASRLSLDESMEREVPRHKACGITAYHLAAVEAFVQKSQPNSGS